MNGRLPLLILNIALSAGFTYAADAPPPADSEAGGAANLWESYQQRRELKRPASTGRVDERREEAAADLRRRLPAANVVKVADTQVIDLPATSAKIKGTVVIVDDRNRALGENEFAAPLAELLALRGWHCWLASVDDLEPPPLDARARFHVEPPNTVEPTSTDADPNPLPAGTRRAWTPIQERVTDKHWLAFKARAKDRLQAVLDVASKDASAPRETPMVVVVRGLVATVATELAICEESRMSAVTFVDLLPWPTERVHIESKRQDKNVSKSLAEELAKVPQAKLFVRWQRDDVLSADSWARVENKRLLDLSASSAEHLARRIAGWIDARVPTQDGGQVAQAK